MMNEYSPRFKRVLTFASLYLSGVQVRYCFRFNHTTEPHIIKGLCIYEYIIRQFLFLQ
jgi:hypothetical protein